MQAGQKRRVGIISTSNEENDTETTSQNEVIKKCNISQKHNGHQHNTDDGGQAIGEEMRHVQMSR